MPSNAESALFGTKMTDEFFPVHIGGDVAFVNGVLKVAARERRRRRGRSSTDHTTGFDGAGGGARRGSRRRPGAAVGRDARRTCERFARMYAARDAAVLVWSMGITQHAYGAENVRRS